MDVDLSETDLENAAVLYGTLKSFRIVDEDAAAHLTARFDVLTQATLTELAAQLDEPSQTEPLRKAAILSAKVKLFDCCWLMLSETTEALKPDMGPIVDHFRTCISEILEVYDVLLRQQPVAAATGADAELAKLRGQVQELTDRNAALSSEVAALQASSSAARSLEADLVPHQPSTHVDGHASSARAQPAAQTRDTQQLQEPPVDGQHYSSPSRDQRWTSTHSKAAGSPSSPSAPAFKILPLHSLLATIEALYASKSKHDLRCDMTKTARETMEQHLYTYLKSKYGLKSLIQDHASTILRSVIRYADLDGDVRSFRALLHNDIDEGFLPIQRALKDAARDALRVILRAGSPLKLSTEVDAELDARTHPVQGIFAQNEWMAIVQKLYGPADAETLMQHLHGSVIKHAVAISMGLSLHDLVNALSTHATSTGAYGDAASALARAESIVQARMLEMGAEQVQSVLARANPTGSLHWHDFICCLLTFQLAGHDKFLSKFREAFRALDHSSSGVVNGAQWKRLVAQTMPGAPPADVSRVCALADPHQTDVITFSSAVAALTGTKAAGGAKQAHARSPTAARSPSNRARSSSMSSLPSGPAPAATSFAQVSNGHTVRPSFRGASTHTAQATASYAWNDAVRTVQNPGMVIPAIQAGKHGSGSMSAAGQSSQVEDKQQRLMAYQLAAAKAMVDRPLSSSMLK